MKSRSDMTPADWAALMEPVARALLGDPSSKTRNEWRYGSHGSLVVHIGGKRHGTWHSFETGEGGGVVKLVDRESGGDPIRWLVEHGFIAANDDDGRSAAGSEPCSAALPGDDDNPIPGHERNAGPERLETVDPLPERAPFYSTASAPPASTGEEERDTGPPPPPPEAPDDDADRIAAANRIFGAAIPDTTPVKAYFASRGAWPPSWPLPTNIRWLPRAAAERLNETLPDPIYLPKRADGCAVYGFGNPASGQLVAVQIEPLTADGRRAPWPARKPGGKPTARQSRGPTRGTALPVKPPGADSAGPLHIAEGPIDALAIACWRGVGAWSAGGTSGLAPLAPALAATGRHVVIEADGDRAGRCAAGELLRTMRGYGGSVRIEDWLLDRGHESDSGEGLAGDWAERAAILEFDGGMTRAEAETAAWNAMRTAGGLPGRMSGRTDMLVKTRDGAR